ncbi:MAG: signal peptidase I [Rubripirellula sp.]
MAAQQNSKKSGKSAEKSKRDDRDPAEVRAESFRVAAQRETVEAFVVAFILALLFRGFLAEAFVIPTGSMAPTLMGAHKDLFCDECGSRFQVGASRERSDLVTNQVVVAGICPNCRHVNALDLVNNDNDATFNGDRILVSKYSYAVSDPKRWDVIVFKFPGNPKQNYIKRLVGLPEETLTITHGDIYTRPTGSEQTSEIIRKPPSKLLAMSQLVYDTEFQAPALIKSHYPSRWQPWRQGATEPPTDSWTVSRTSDGLNAKLEASDNEQHWLRYFHHWPTDAQWKTAQQGGSLADVNPYASRAITDFYTYGSYVLVPASFVYQEAPSTRRGSGFERMNNGGFSNGEISPRYQPGVGPEQFGGSAEWGGQDGTRQQIGRDGLHWVGDLLVTTDIETSSDSSEVMLELVEAGVKYRCAIDLTSGQATLTIDDVESRYFSGQTPASGAGSPTAQTGVIAGSRHSLRFSNCDDQLLLWVDDKLIEFDKPTTYDARQFRTPEQNHPQYLVAHPLDAAPAAVAVRGGKSTVHGLKIDRDKYYIATSNSNFGIHDYDQNLLWRLSGGSVSHRDIQNVFASPEQWSDFVGWQTRRTVTFELGEDQFFPMGDNSPESLDARCWAGTKRKIPMPREANKDAWKWANDHFVPRNLLVGKALVVFWPHSWNDPIPYTPNLNRMKLIR